MSGPPDQTAEGPEVKQFLWFRVCCISLHTYVWTGARRTMSCTSTTAWCIAWWTWPQREGNGYQQHGSDLQCVVSVEKQVATTPWPKGRNKEGWCQFRNTAPFCGCHSVFPPGQWRLASSIPGWRPSEFLQQLPIHYSHLWFRAVGVEAVQRNGLEPLPLMARKWGKQLCMEYLSSRKHLQSSLVHFPAQSSRSSWYTPKLMHVHPLNLVGISTLKH